jgi:hypothetical protein
VHFGHFERDGGDRISYKLATSQHGFFELRHMRIKRYKVRSLTAGKSKQAALDFEMEFDGKRAFVVWDSITMGKFKLKARVEIDPELLFAAPGRGCDYLYRGQLVLPRPENN